MTQPTDAEKRETLEEMAIRKPYYNVLDTDQRRITPLNSPVQGDTIIGRVENVFNRDMEMKKFCKKSPCNNCPYRKDAPLAYWSRQEFIDLIEKDSEYMGASYGCHKNDGTLCTGFVMNRQKSSYDKHKKCYDISYQSLAFIACYKSDNPFQNAWLAVGVTSWIAGLIIAIYTVICLFVPGVNRWYRVVFRIIFIIICLFLAHYCGIRSL